jgi:hypothetical protein
MNKDKLNNIDIMSFLNSMQNLQRGSIKKKKSSRCTIKEVDNSVEIDESSDKITNKILNDPEKIKNIENIDEEDEEDDDDEEEEDEDSELLSLLSTATLTFALPILETPLLAAGAVAIKARTAPGFLLLVLDIIII